MANLPTRKNNPGDLRPTGSSKGFQTFTSPQAGFEALKADITGKITGNTKTKLGPNSTLVDFASTWAPASDHNNPVAYAQNLAKTLNVPVTHPIGNLSAHNLSIAVAKQEGYKGQLPTPEVTSTPTKSKNMQPNPDTFKQLLLTAHPNAVASDGRKYSDIPALELTQKAIQAHPDGVTNSGLKYSDFLPAQTQDQAQQPVQTKGQQMQQRGNDLAKSILTPFVKVGGRIVQAAHAVGQQVLSGGKSTAPIPEYNVPTPYGSIPVNDPSKETHPILKQLGAGAEAVSYALGGGEAQQVVDQGAKGLVKKLAFQGAKEGAKVGAVAGLGSALQGENPTVGSVAKSTALNAVAGGGIGAGFGALSAKGFASPEAKAKAIANKNLEHLTQLENNNAPLRKVIAKNNTRGINVKDIIANTDLLHGSVDKTGTLRTTHPGGAVEQLTHFIEPQESVISKNLVKEGKTVPLKKVESVLRTNVDNSNLEGAALENAHSKIDAEMKGLARRADKSGNIALAKVHDAKVNKYATVDYMNEGSKMADKAIAKGLKTVVEKNTQSVEVQKLNDELSKHYAVLNTLEKLDGKKVQGGKVGKYFARTLGGIIGSHFGPLGAIAGEEIAGAVHGQNMQSTFGKKIGTQLEQSDAMKAAIKNGNTKEPQKLLPVGRSNSSYNAVPIPLNAPTSYEAQAKMGTHTTTNPNTGDMYVRDIKTGKLKIVPGFRKR